MSELIVETTDATFESDVLNSELPVLLDFWAPWCGPCKAVAPMLDRIATEYEGRLRVVKYNVDQSEDSWKRFNFRGIPTVMAYSGGKEIARTTGFNQINQKILLETLLTTPAAVSAGPVVSFGGDAGRKALCVARVQQAIDTGALAKQDIVSVDGSDLPSTRAAGGPNASYSEVLGVPEVFAHLQNVFFGMLPAKDGSNTRFALEWVEAIPVGVDLAGIPLAYTQWLLHDPQWGIAACVPQAVDAVEEDTGRTLRVLWKDMIVFHQREASGELLPPSVWEALRARISALAGTASLKGLPEQLCDVLSIVSTSLAVLNGATLIELMNKITMLKIMQLHLIWWSQEEKAVHDTFQKARGEQIKTLGAIPETIGAERDAWVQQAVAIKEKWQAGFDSEHPEIAERQTALSEASEQLPVAQCVASTQHLFGLMRAAPPATLA